MDSLRSAPHRPAVTARLAALIALIGAALAACATQPRLGAAPAPKPAEAYETVQSFQAPAADWPGDRWWTAYGDPQLDQLIDGALAGAPDMAAAEARVRKAQAAEGEANAALLPQLSGNATVADEKQSYNLGIPPAFVPKGYNGFGELTLSLNWEIDFWGKNRAAVAAATSDARAAQADAAEARLTLSTAVAGAYAQLSQLYAERDVAERTVASRQETLDLTTRRVADGAATKGDAGEARGNVAAAKADLAAQDEQIALTRDQIAALLGEGPDRGLSIQRPPAAALKAFGLPPKLAADLIGRRPDVAAARWRAQAAAKRIGEAKAEFYPDVNLAAFIGYESLGLDKLFAAGSSVGQIGPAVSLPIFEGGKLRANLRGARADYDAAVASYDDTLTQALRQVADAANSERALAERLDQSQAALAADEDAYRIAKLRFEGGLSNYQSVLLVEDSVLRDRRAVVDLQARAFILDVQLVSALGGGFTA